MSAQRLLQHFHHAMGLLLIAAVALMLGLGPFLHAHLGSSSVTGFHVDSAALPALAHSEHDHAVLTAVHDNESPAVGVASGYPARDAQARQIPDASAFFMLALFLASVLSVLALSIPRRWPPLLRQCGFDRPGLPPPAQAPPSFR